MCEYAPSSMRTSASTASASARRVTVMRRHVRVLTIDARRPHARAPRRRRHRRLPSGCTSSSTSNPSPVTSSAVGRDAPGLEVRRTPVGAGMRAPHLHPPAADRASTRPGAGCRRARCRSSSIAGRAGSSRNSSTVSFSAYVGSPACGSGVAVAIFGTCSTSSCVPTSTSRCAARPRFPRPDRRPVAWRRPGRCRGRPRAASRTRRSRCRRRGSPARPAPRRATAAATRSARSRSPTASASSNETGSSWPNATTTPSSAPDARTSSTTSRALSGVRTGSPSSSAARRTGDGSLPAPRDRRRSGCVTTSATS